jgi:hypothetical protein
VRTGVVATVVVAWSLSLPSSLLQAQQHSSTELALSFAAGSAFQGVGVGLAHTTVAAGSALSVGSGFGGGSYGVYDSGYWGQRGGYVHSGYRYGGYRYGGYRCADVWGILDGPYYGAIEAGFYDDWFYFSDLYYDCVVRGPSWVYHRYHSYRPYHRAYYRPFRFFRPQGIYISIAIVDPFWPAWGPFYAYDPWGHYWSNWIVVSARPRVRTVHVAPGPIYRRPSPIYVAGTGFKEDPRGGAPQETGRRAQPRPGSAPEASAPATPRTGIGIQAPPRRTAGGVAGGSPDGASTATRDGTRTAEPRRSGDGAARPSAPVAPGPAGNAPRATDTDRRGPVVSPEPTNRDGGNRQPSSPPQARPGTERPSTPGTGKEPPRRGTPAAQGQPSPTRSTRPAPDQGASGRGPETPSTTNRPSSALRQAQPNATLPTVVTPESQPSTTLPKVITPGSTPARTLPQVIVPRSQPAADRRAEPAQTEQAPERLTGPMTRPGSAPQQVRGGDRRSLRGRPSDPARQAEPQATPTPQPGQGQPRSSTAPQAQPAPDRSSSRAPQGTRAPERGSTPQPQAAPGRSQAPQARPAPARSTAPERRAQPAPTRPSPPPQQAPSRPSAPQAQPAPSAPPSGGARPLPAPRRPGGEADAL